MARHLYRRIGRKRRSSRFRVAEVTIKSRKRCTRADDSQINNGTVRSTKKILRSIHQCAAQPGALAPRFHAEQTQVAAIPANFDIDAASKARGIFRQEKFSSPHVLANSAGIDAITLDEGQLGAERYVDQRGERCNICAHRVPNPRGFPGRRRSGGFHNPSVSRTTASGLNPNPFLATTSPPREPRAARIPDRPRQIPGRSR